MRTWLSNVGGAGLIPSWEAKILHALWPKNQNTHKKNRSNILTNSIKILKMAHIKKKKKKPISCFKNLSPAHHCFYRSPSLHHTASEPRLKSPHPFPHSCQSNLEKGKSCICLSQLNLFSSFPSHLE